jgi:hypothetical protein
MEFHGFGELIEHAVGLAEVMEEVLHEGMEAITAKLLHDTREKFGEYQGGAGPFQPWPPLASATIADREARGFSPDEPLLRTGELRDSYYKQVEGLEGGVGSDLDKALGMEVGDPAKNVPARPTVGLAFAENEEKLFKLTGISLEAALIYGRGVSKAYSSLVSRRS